MHFYHVKLIQDTTIEMCVKVKYKEDLFTAINSIADDYFTGTHSIARYMDNGVVLNDYTI